MNRAVKVLLSVFVWWALVVLPGALTIAGVFGDIGTDTSLGGWIILWWVVCYCAQLAMVYVMQKAVGHSRSWWFFVASLLPWAVDWSAPVGWGWGLLWIGFAGLFAVAIILLALRTLALDEHGTVVTATVKKVMRFPFNVVINSVYIYRHVLLDIPGTDGSPSYEGKLWMLYEIGNAPIPGEHVQLRVDPRNPQHFAVDRSHYARD